MSKDAIAIVIDVGSAMSEYSKYVFYPCRHILSALYKPALFLCENVPPKLAPHMSHNNSYLLCYLPFQRTFAFLLHPLTQQRDDDA